MTEQSISEQSKGCAAVAGVNPGCECRLILGCQCWDTECPRGAPQPGSRSWHSRAGSGGRVKRDKHGPSSSGPCPGSHKQHHPSTAPGDSPCAVPCAPSPAAGWPRPWQGHGGDRAPRGSTRVSVAGDRARCQAGAAGTQRPRPQHQSHTGPPARASMLRS